MNPTAPLNAAAYMSVLVPGSTVPQIVQVQYQPNGTSPQAIQVPFQSGLSVFPWQGWQPASAAPTPGRQQPLAQAQWMAVPAMAAPQTQTQTQTQAQTRTGGQSQAAQVQAHQHQQSMVAVNDLPALAAAIRPLLQGENAPPVGSSPNDETLLNIALKEGRRDGLTPRQALDKLHGVNKHTDIAWKNYFLDHLERIYPKIFLRGTVQAPANVPLYIPSAPQPVDARMHTPGKKKKPHHIRLRDRSGMKIEKMKLQTGKRTQPASGSSAQGQHRTAECGAPQTGGGIKKPRPQDFASTNSTENEEDGPYTEGSATSDEESSQLHSSYTSRPPQLVTEDDLRAMARYTVENPPEEGRKATGNAYWLPFANRSKNAQRRSHSGWTRAALTYVDKIESYARELAQAASMQEDGTSHTIGEGYDTEAQSGGLVGSPSVTMSGGDDAAASRVPQKRPVAAVDAASCSEEGVEPDGKRVKGQKEAQAMAAL